MADPDRNAAPLAAGARLGRYEIVRVLGQGGMGIVYEAHDPQLDRRVALKVLRRDAWGDSEDDGRARLLREAQAMARLSHPNVVAVFDAGMHDDQLYVAMEYVDGMTLRRWLATETLDSRSILDAFVSAGRGLAAAHEVGLVHRDFKPENVLRSKNGRISVADFGLAHSTSTEAASDAGLAASSTDRLALRMTQSGTVLGTPAYMAPEQLEGARADERTDQFSFCVALYEALYGEPPFAGGNFDELAAEVMAGHVRPAPAGTRVPDALRQVLLRGLARKPSERHGSMTELMGLIAPRPRRSRLALAAAGAALVVLGGTALYLVKRPTLMCRGSEQRLAGIWDRPRKEAIHAAFTATKLPYAEDAWSALSRVFDDDAMRWARMRTDACEATRVRGEQSELLLDLRMECLDSHLRDAGALSNFLLQADPKTVQHALDSFATLPPLDRCANTRELSLRAPMPADRGTRTELDSLDTSIGRVKMLMAAGKLEDAMKVVAPLVAVAERLHYPPLLASSLGARGRLEMVSGETTKAIVTLKSALFNAEAANDDPQVAKLWNDLMRAYVELGQLDDAEQAHQHGVAFVKRLSDPAPVQAELDYTAGVMHMHGGRYDDARADFLSALAVWEKREGHDSHKSESAISALATRAAVVGDGKEAVDYAMRAFEIDRRVLGPNHPDLVNTEQTLGTALASVGRMKEAYAAYRAALDIAERALPPDHPMLAQALGNWAGTQLSDEKRYPEAIAAYQRVLAIQSAHQSDSALIGQTFSNLGAIEIDAGKLDDAQRDLDRSLAIKEKALGPDSDEVGRTLVLLGDLAQRRKRYEEALRLELRAKTIFEKTLGPQSLNLWDALNGYGLAAVSLSQGAKAIPSLERAIAIRVANGGDKVEPEAAWSRFLLARALWQAGDRALSMTDAKAAVAVLEKSDPEKNLPEVKAFLAHPR